MNRWTLIAALLLAGCSGAPRTGGAPELTSDGRCIRTQFIRQSFARNGATIDFEMKTGRAVRNRLSEACPDLGPTRSILYRAHGDRLCAGDLITVLSASSPVPGATCALGAFEPLERRAWR